MARRAGRRRDPASLALRRAVIETARDMSRRGLSPGLSGNVSVRDGDGMLLTPSGMAYADLDADDIVRVALDGTVEPGQRRPSSEWQLHAAAYRVRADRSAVVHCHSTHAVVLACLGRPIPAFHYMVAVAGGDDIPCAPYATFGTAELAEVVAARLADREACLMASHGQIAIGATLAEALEIATEVERLAEQYWKALAIGPPRLLDRQEMARVKARFATYGQRAQDARPKRADPERR